MKIAIIGATGAVGREMLNALIELDIPVDELVPLASARSAGTKINFKGKEVVVQELTHDSFKGCDVVLGASSVAVAKEYAPSIKAAGAVFIDNSSAFRMDPDVPLVVPEINGADAKKHNGIISNPNCSTIITCMAVHAINSLSPIKAMIASTYQAVSGAGKGGIEELQNQIKELSATTEKDPVTGCDVVNPLENPNNKIFPYQIAYNCIPCIGSEKTEGYTSEEMKLENEGRKIMHLPDLNVTCTCVRVPVIRSHCISVSLMCERPLELDEVRKAVGAFPGVQLVDDLNDAKYPMPLFTANQNDVFVGRIRRDRVLPGGISLFCCGDQIRKGAAANAVQIIKCL